MIIYLITNTENSKVYIGQTIRTAVRRFSQHRNNLNRLCHSNPHLQAAWNKYGADAFTFEVLDTAVTLNGLNAKEEYYIQLYESSNPQFGYNKRAGGLNGNHSEETKRRIGRANRTAQTGKKLADETKQKIRAHFTNRPRGDMFIQKIAKPHPAFIHQHTGQIIPAGINLKKTCQTYGLEYTTMIRVKKGSVKCHKGYTLYEDTQR